MRTKLLAITAVIALVLGTLSLSYAFGGGMGPGKRGGGMGSGMNMGPGMMDDLPPCYESLTPELQQKVKDFHAGIKPLKLKMIQLKEEIFTLRTQANPDPAAVNAKRAEMFKVRDEIHAKAQAAGVFGLCKPLNAPQQPK